MAQTDINQTTTSDLKNVEYDHTDTDDFDFSVNSQEMDSPSDQQETTWINDKFTQYLGYYKTIPELRQAINALATWTAGKGWTSPVPFDEVILNKMTGWGEDSFQTIMENMIIMKKVNGDAFAEIIRNEEGTLINIKPLSPARIQIVVNREGIIKRYEQLDKQRQKSIKKFQPKDMFHISNDRVGDEIHGTLPIDRDWETVSPVRS